MACTRFNNETYQENMDYRKKHNIKVIYGSSLNIRHIYSQLDIISVAEMNNDKNRIEGIGLIQNIRVTDKYYKIYNNNQYNQFIYRGEYWMDRKELDTIDPNIGVILDNILFKKKSHLKCRLGITVLSDKLFNHWDEYSLEDLNNRVKRVFVNKFSKK
jgi:hypothetical protein